MEALVNMDVLTALEKEAKYEKNEYDATRIRAVCKEGDRRDEKPVEIHIYRASAW